MAKLLVVASALLLSINLALRALPEAPLTPQQRTKSVEAAALQFEKKDFEPDGVPCTVSAHSTPVKRADQGKR